MAHKQSFEWIQAGRDAGRAFRASGAAPEYAEAECFTAYNLFNGDDSWLETDTDARRLFEDAFMRELTD